MTTPTVHVVDDHPAVRASLTELLNSAGLPVRAFASASEFLEAWRDDWAGCLLLDVRLPGMSGLELQEELRARGVELPVIIVTGHGDVPMAVRALTAGALDFLEKPCQEPALLVAVRRALARDEANRQARSRRADVDGRLRRLTPREREVMDLLCTGLPTKTVAGRLGISRKTVDVHRARILEKMTVDSTVELVHLLSAGAPAGREGG
jgi:RNA polymerase sigma factor (sigma-70 family)